METEKIPLFKQPLFWLIVALAVLLTGAMIFMVIAFRNVLFAETAPTEETIITEPTLPPPAENPYDAMDFAIGEDGYLTCLSGESILGVDVSSYQGYIDWQQVADAGIEFAIIKCAGRGYGEAGRLYTDNYWRTNYEGAKNAGLAVGVYFFSQAITPEEAVEEAEYVLALLDGMPLEMPIVYDWEYIDPATADGVPRTIAMSARDLTDCSKAFCDTIEAAGYDSMIYFNANQSHKKMYLEELTDYPFWLASYTTELNYPYKIDMWQYTDSGSVPGISGSADLNLYLKYE